MAKTVQTEKANSQETHWKLLAFHWYNKAQKERQDRLNAQQRQQAVEDMFDEYRNAYNAMTKKRTEEAKKLSTQEIFADYSACSKIDNVYKEHKTPFPLKIGMWTAITIIALVAIWQYSSNPEVRAGINSSSGFIVVLLALAVAFYYLYTRGKK
jgi:hypothetical protein